ncbi:MAG TPA: hypothetical protein VFQ23_12205, partial [Anaerolineales bacterium]|nr:hypothetical protein [Anaerolineales bacterium]
NQRFFDNFLFANIGKVLQKGKPHLQRIGLSNPGEQIMSSVLEDGHNIALNVILLPAIRDVTPSIVVKPNYGWAQHGHADSSRLYKLRQI